MMLVKEKPLVLKFFRPLENEVLEKAVGFSEVLRNSYNEELQISNYDGDRSIYLGTSLTYDTTYTGIFSDNDDNRQSDT